MKSFLDQAALQNHPMRALTQFLEAEEASELAKKYDELRFVGYVMDIGFDTVSIITSDRFKVVVGGVPRNSLLIMTPSAPSKTVAPHFTLLRVLEAASTPLSSETQQTYFELQKKSMPELDIFTQSELQWGALKTGVLGMFYANPDVPNAVEFSGDINNYVSAHKYKVYAPSEALLKLVVNSLVPTENRFDIGDLRLTECRLPVETVTMPPIKVCVSTKDFMGSRTAMFGKTRLGKSNVVKMIAQSIIETTATTKNVGQLIFDVNGEYANDNPQDGNTSLASAYKTTCDVYALTPKENTPSKPLKLNFYAHPASSLPILASLLATDEKSSANYISAFLSVDLPSLESIAQMNPGDQIRAKRKVLIYWAILQSAGFTSDDAKLKLLISSFDPKYNATAMKQVFGDDIKQHPKVSSLDQLVDVLSAFAVADRQQSLPSSTPGKALFDADDRALLGFLSPASTTSSGAKIIQKYRRYHDKNAGNFVSEILDLLTQGRTVIIDLGNAPPELMEYFSKHLSLAVFASQVDKFSNNKLGDTYVQLYFEEAHNLFAPSDTDEGTKIYRRLAKEGAKYHIGMVYSTQSVTSVSKDLLAQTENFFIAHLASQDEVNALAKMNVAYNSMKEDIMLTKTPGYMRMLTRSHRFVVPMQAHRFQFSAGSK